MSPAAKRPAKKAAAKKPAKAAARKPAKAGPTHAQAQRVIARVDKQIEKARTDLKGLGDNLGAPVSALRRRLDKGLADARRDAASAKKELVKLEKAAKAKAKSAGSKAKAAVKAKPASKAKPAAKAKPKAAARKPANSAARKPAAKRAATRTKARKN